MRQILRVFGRLRGLSKRAAEGLIEEAAEALRLESYLDQEFDTLSGGTKRKVCDKIYQKIYYLIV